MRTNIIAPIFKSTIVEYWTPNIQDLNPKRSSNKAFYLVSLVLVFAFCDIRHAEETTVLDTIGALKSLSRDMDSLKSLNDNMWNQVSQTIERAIPADLPVTEKQNLLMVKNADLIQMFEVFESLDDALQHQVLEAGKSDQETAQKMRDIMTKVDELNKTLSQNLATLTKKDPVTADRLRLEIKPEKRTDKVR